MKKNLLALLMGTMVVASLVVGCGDKAADKEADKKTEATDKKDDAKEESGDKADKKAEGKKKAEEKTEAASEETKAAAAVEADDVDVYYADLSDDLAGSGWISTDGEIWLFDEDGVTFLVSDGEEYVEGYYALEMLTDGEDVLMGLTMYVEELDFEAFYFVTGLDLDNEALYLMDEDGNESALVEFIEE